MKMTDVIKHMVLKSTKGIGIIGILAILLGLIFTVLKVGTIIAWGWAWVLAPFWIYAIAKFLLFIISIFIV